MLGDIGRGEAVEAAPDMLQESPRLKTSQVDPRDAVRVEVAGPEHSGPADEIEEEFRLRRHVTICRSNL